MAMRPISSRLLVTNIVIIFIIIFDLFYCNALDAMGKRDPLKMYRDIGIIGEEKTVQGEKVYYDESTGITYHVHKSGSFVTPKVIGDVAYFDLNLEYSFKFECLDWKYNIEAYWSSADVTEERVGFLVSLESPDERTFIDIKKIDIPVYISLSIAPTQEQFNIAQLKGYVEDPFLGDECTLATQQAIKWILDKDRDDYKILENMPIKFTSEQIGSSLFSKAEIDIFSKNDGAMKKCVVWALNHRGYRLKDQENVRRMETWICKVVTCPSNYSSAVSKAYMILETFKFGETE